MFRQLEYFQEYQKRVSAMIGAKNAKKLVSKALVLITVGGNDFVNNYFLVPFSARSRQFSLPDYVVFLISEYKKLLMVIDTSLPVGRQLIQPPPRISFLLFQHPYACKVCAFPFFFMDFLSSCFHWIVAHQNISQSFPLPEFSSSLLSVDTVSMQAFHGTSVIEH